MSLLRKLTILLVIGLGAGTGAVQTSSALSAAGVHTALPKPRQLYAVSLKTMAALAGYHTQGTSSFANAGYSVTSRVKSDCGKKGMHVVLRVVSSTDPNAASTEVIWLTPNKMWFRQAPHPGGTWTKWQRPKGDNWLALASTTYYCPVGSQIQTGVPGDVKTWSVTNATLHGKAVWHLHMKGDSGAKFTVGLDIEQSTLHWLKVVTTERRDYTATREMTFSRFGRQVQLAPPTS